MTKISKLKFGSPQQAEAENLRKMILAMVDDIRVILVKLADRLHNMRTLGHLEPHKRQRIARETADIYAPLANRLGIGRIKSELEDLSFEHLQPERHKRLVRLLDARRKISDEFIEEIRGKLASALVEQKIEAEITGRIKSTYSIYRKMKEQGIEVDEVYDYVAFRVVSGSVKDCYGALGIVHSIWSPVPGQDQGLHRDAEGQRLPVVAHLGDDAQGAALRDPDPHPRHAPRRRGGDRGPLAVQGGEGRQPGRRREGRLAAAADGLAEGPFSDPTEFMELMKVDLYPEEVYTFTPKGRVLSFPVGATPIDFAYTVHTEVGHRCVGARVNGRIVPLKYQLKNGDIVEILTQANHHPNRDWLGLVKTSRARSKIRAWLNANERERSVALGKGAGPRRSSASTRCRSSRTWEASGWPRCWPRWALHGIDDFYAAVGFGKVTPHGLLTALVPEEELPSKREGTVSRVVKRALGLGERRVKVKGFDDMLIHLAQCCNPVRGEPIVGYISRGKGVSVHSARCPNVAQLMYDSDRKIGVEWDSAPGPTCSTSSCRSTYATDRGCWPRSSS